MERVLVITNKCFSKNEANGKTMANYFHNIDKKDIAQLYMSGIPDTNICVNNYQIKDVDVIKSLVKRNKCGNVILEQDISGMVEGTNATVTKTPFKALVRELCWSICPWESEEFKKWLNEFSPTCIFLCFADNAFLAKMAIKIARKRQIPIILYSTENHCFKEYNYMNNKKSILYKIFRRNLYNSLLELDDYLDGAVFNIPELVDLYSNVLSVECKYAYMSTTVDFCHNYILPENQDDFTISYIGNLFLNRHKALIEIADSIQEIGLDIKINIYGKMISEIKDELLSHPNIVYCGFINSGEVIDVIRKSNLLIHAEYISEFINEEVKYGFSTKISDSVCSGSILFAYGDKNSAGINFLNNTKSAFVVTDKGLLSETLKDALFSLEKRIEVSKNAESAKVKYFSNDKNFLEILKGDEL